jgi:hypothetical protein
MAARVSRIAVDLTRSDMESHVMQEVDSPSTMDAATIADRHREGGGAPSERRPAVPVRWVVWSRAAETDA